MADSGGGGGDALAARLRRENVEQFLTLVRMHLSFVVDINTDDVDSSTEKPKQFRWGFNKKTRNIPTASQTSTTNNKCSTDTCNTITDDGISKVYELIIFLMKEENVTQEGIFRRTGSLSRQQELKQLLMTGSTLGLDEGRFSVHDCASVLKGFLAELPQPLLMDQYYQTYCTLAVQYPPNVESSKCRLLTALQLLLMLLSPLHRDFLQRLLALLHTAADKEASNRMSSDTIATMFTPHLLCPRKLGPEALHSDAVALAPIISFMIRHSERLFEMPCQLATDIAAYFTMRERKRLMSPDIDLDESISDRTAANTVYTFVDRHRTSAENEANPTDTALAQLYAHIQALPDSQHKRRLVKQFNRQNGYGTPIQVQRAGKTTASKSLGESIKKHIFNKGLLNKTPKKGSSGTIRAVSEKRATFNKGKLRFSNEDNGKSIEVSHKNIVLKNLANQMERADTVEDDNDGFESDASNESTRSEGSLMDRPNKLSPKFVSEPNLSVLESRIDNATPINTKKASRLFRSKALSASRNLNKKYIPKRATAIRSTPTSCVSCVEEQSSSDSESSAQIDNQQSLDDSPKTVENMTPRLSRKDSMKYVQCRGLLKEDSRNISDKKSFSKLQYITSTPGIVTTEVTDEALTPYFVNFRRASMSPITKSTQKLCKAMQESIMTPRSRKPLIVTSEQRDNSLTVETKENKPTTSSDTIYDSITPKNDSDFVSSDESGHLSSHVSSSPQRSSQYGKTEHVSVEMLENRKANGDSRDLNHTLCSSNESVPTVPHFKTSYEMSPNYLKECKTKSLTVPFREYLLSRSVLTATPVDLSFVNKSSDETADERISDSLMFCLDGNTPSDLTLGINNVAMEKTEADDTQNVRSPLKNLKNYINSNCEKSPNRKRAAVVSDKSYYDDPPNESHKKMTLPSESNEKENLVNETKNIKTSPWETDL